MGHPGHDLIEPNVASGDPALCVGIGDGAKVALIRVGTMPVLGYVEGCAASSAAIMAEAGGKRI